MATNCEDVSARMMELLYGELAADERASVDAHVAGCARCRSELEGFEKTRAVARQVLGEAPPARAHAAILKAAAARVAAQAQPAARRAVAPERPSLWARLRLRWALPTFATVGAVAVFLIANRVFLNPERTLEKVHHEAPEAAPPEAPALAPAAGGMAEPAAASEGAKASDSEAHLRQQLQAARERLAEVQKSARSEGHGKKELEAPVEMRGGDQKPAAATGRVEDYRRRGKDAPGAAPATPPRASRRAIADNPLDGLLDSAPAAPTAPAVKEKAERDRSRFAPPPPPRGEPAAAPEARSADKAEAPKRKMPAEAQPAAPPKGSLDDLLSAPSGGARAGGSVGGLESGKNKGGGYGSGPTAQPAPVTTSSSAPTSRHAAPSPAIAPPAPAAAPPPPAAKARAKASDEAEEAPAQAPAEADTKAEKKKKAGAARPYASETLAQRADRLFAEGRWAEAAEVYRELLQRDPRNEEAERWRRRLVAAESADSSEHNASVAERRAAAKKSLPAKAAKTAAPKAAAGAAVDQ